MSNVENTAEIDTLVGLYRRRRKKNKPVETVVESLNRLGARRPTKQRFMLSFDSTNCKLTLKAKMEEFVPDSLRRIADQLIIGPKPLENSDHEASCDHHDGAS